MPPGLPVATLFSGGIDSTLIAHYARRFRPEAPGYFVGGTDAPDYPFAAAYAEQTGSTCAWCRSIRKAMRSFR